VLADPVLTVGVVVPGLLYCNVAVRLAGPCVYPSSQGARGKGGYDFWAALPLAQAPDQEVTMPLVSGHDAGVRCNETMVLRTGPSEATPTQAFELAIDEFDVVRRITFLAEVSHPRAPRPDRGQQTHLTATGDPWLGGHALGWRPSGGGLRAGEPYQALRPSPASAEQRREPIPRRADPQLL
jgi:hypothetical protein